MDGAAFYKALAYKLQLVHGQVGYKPSTQELGAMAPQIANLQPAEEQMNISVSVHRSLISIGDLTRWEGLATWFARSMSGGCGQDSLIIKKFTCQATCSICRLRAG